MGYQAEDKLSIAEPSKASDKYCVCETANASTEQDGDAAENEDDSDCSSSDHEMSGEDEDERKPYVGDVATDDITE